MKIIFPYKGIKSRYQILGMGIVTLVAISAVWLNLEAMERNRVQEYKNIANKMVEMATTFVIRKQYDNLLALMQLQTQTQAIQFMGYYINGEPILQAGRTQTLDRSRDRLFLSPGQSRQAVRTAHYLYLDQELSLPKEDLIKRSVIRVVFSFREFNNRKQNIVIFIGVIFGLLGLLALLLYLLHQTHEKLKYEENTKTNMLKAIAHDALHYVNVIQIMNENQLSNMQKKKSSSEVKEYIYKLLETNDSLTRLLENLKYNEYLSKGVVINRPENIPWVEFLDRMIKRMQELYAKKQVRLKFIHQHEAAMVWADKKLMEQMVFNLLHNAFKFTRPGSTITLRLKEEGQKIITLIQDQGSGIPRSEWEHIFEPAVRLEMDAFVRPEDKRGSGLGLSNSRQIVQLYGGSMGVHSSEINVGTTFYFTLPIIFSGAGLEIS